MVVMVTLDRLTKGNKTLAYHLKVQTLTKSQHQLPDRIKERKLIKEETTNHHPHQEILGEIPTQMTMTMMITIITAAMAGAGEADVWNATLENHQSQEILLPALKQC